MKRRAGGHSEMTHAVRLSPAPHPTARGLFLSQEGTPLRGSGYLARYSVGAELPKAQRGLDPPQQGHHIQVLDSAPAGGHTDSRTWRPHLEPPSLLREWAKGPRARRQGTASLSSNRAYEVEAELPFQRRKSVWAPLPTTSLFIWAERGQNSFRYGISRPGIRTSFSTW